MTSLTSLLSRGRGAAKRLMTDTCVITRRDPAAAPVLNESTLEYSAAVTPTTMYDGICRITSKGARFDRVVQAGEEPVTTSRVFVDLPVDADYSAAVDDIITITSSALDPELVDSKLRVRQPHFGSQVTAQHLGCEWTELGNG